MMFVELGNEISLFDVGGSVFEGGENAKTLFTHTKVYARARAHRADEPNLNFGKVAIVVSNVWIPAFARREC